MSVGIGVTLIQVLVGDPLQLPPTVAGPEAENKDSLDRSMFERLAEAGLTPILLRTQYRVTGSKRTILLTFASATRRSPTWPINCSTRIG